MDWDKKDNIQRLLTVMECDVRAALKCAMQYGYVIDLVTNELDFINEAPCFWTEVICSFRYSIIMQAARLFDESKNAIGMNTLFNRLEQSDYKSVVYENLKKIKSEYKSQRNKIQEIKNLRDRIYAHNDKKIYVDCDMDSIVDMPLWAELKEVLVWAKDALDLLRQLCGDTVIFKCMTENDVKNLLKYKTNENDDIKCNKK